MFSVTGRQPHKERKRILTSLYSKSTLHASPEVRKISSVLLLDRLLPAIESSIQRGVPLDVLEHSLAISIDFITAYLFGLDNSTNFLEDADARVRWLYAHGRTKGQYFWHRELPVLSSVVEALGISIVNSDILSLTKDVKDLCFRLMERVEVPSSVPLKTTLKDGDSNWTKPIVYEHLQQHLEPQLQNGDHPSTSIGSAQKRLTIASELMDHIMAGTETSGWTLTYIMYELSLHPELQSSLRSELFSIVPPLVYKGAAEEHDFPLPPARALDSLPILDAIALETMRRYPAVPGAQPRVSRTNVSLDRSRSCNIPPGIRVSAQAYSLHRNEDVFPDPETWSPMRWVTCDKDERERMLRWFWAFGSGGRMCIGNHLAMLG